MISHMRVDEVKRLLSEGKYSQRRIARMTGISRATIGSIANGTRPDYPLRTRDEDELFDAPTGPPERCPGCGGRVYLPCRLCRVRGIKAAEQERRRRRAWFDDYLSGPLVPRAVVLAEQNRAKRRAGPPASARDSPSSR